MKYDFVKIHGAGNDFVFIEDLDAKIELTPEQIAFVCDRHFGVGADGVILVRPASMEGCDGFMCYYNSDGTVAQMCGNGVRCFAKYMVDRQLVDLSKGYIDVETLAGRKHITYQLDEDGKLVMAQVNMGQPILDGPSIPTTLTPNAEGNKVIEVPVSTPYGDVTATCVSMGNPHCIVFMDNSEFFDNPSSFQIDKIGPYMECNPIFPEKCNIEFVYVDMQDDGWAHTKMRVWERGCGETLACGTGACATGVASNLAGKAGRKSEIQLLGGTLKIEWQDNGDILMTGPATQVYTGQIEI